MKDVIVIDEMVSEYAGDRVREKKYKANYNGTIIEALMWCAWIEKKSKWGKWHVSYRMPSGTYYDDPFEMIKFIAEMHISR